MKFGSNKATYVKRPPLGGKQQLRHSLLVGARILAVLAAIVLVVVAIPRVFRIPMDVKINGETVRALSGSEVGTVVRQNLNWNDYKGDLLAVDGSVLKGGGGGDPVITSGGNELPADKRIRFRMTLTVLRGEDEIEPVVKKEVQVEPSLDLKGKGPLRIITAAGQIGVTVKYMGETSGKEQKSEVMTAVEAVVVKAKSAASVKPKVVALTFDDGPNPEATEQILKILASEGVKATFFMQGSSVNKHPELAKKVADQGHQLGNHSLRHKEYTKLTPAEIESDIQLAQEAIAEATGVTPTWARAPYGAVNATVYSLYGENGLNLALWSVDPADWRKPGKSTIIRRVIDNVKPGSVILLHDGGGERSQTTKALRPIIKWLKEQGYTLVTIQQLYDRLQ
jgi:polysaccharide deacetylase family sporulation protein PdaB